MSRQATKVMTWLPSATSTVGQMHEILYAGGECEKVLDCYDFEDPIRYETPRARCSPITGRAHREHTCQLLPRDCCASSDVRLVGFSSFIAGHLGLEVVDPQLSLGPRGCKGPSVPSHRLPNHAVQRAQARILAMRAPCRVAQDLVLLAALRY